MEIKSNVINYMRFFIAFVLSVFSILQAVFYAVLNTMAISYVYLIFLAVCVFFTTQYQFDTKMKKISAGAFFVLFILEAILVITTNLAMFFVFTIASMVFAVVLGFYSFATLVQEMPASKTKNRKKRANIALIVFLVILLIAGIVFISLFGYNAGFIESYAYYDGKIIKGINYGPDRERNSMTIYLPKNLDKNKNNAAFLVVHGGSWISGSKDEISNEAKRIAKQGYIAVAINYSFINNRPRVTMNQILDEMTLALKQLKIESKVYGWNIKQIAITGYSAGGHLTLLYGATRLEECPFPVAFLAAKAPPAVLTPEIFKDSGMVFVGRSADKTFKEYKTEHPELTDKQIWAALASTLSPHNYISEKTPPTICLFGADDTVVPPQQGKILQKAYEEKGVTYVGMELPVGSHLMYNSRKELFKYYDKIFEFAKKHFV